MLALIVKFDEFSTLLKKPISQNEGHGWVHSGSKINLCLMCFCFLFENRFLLCVFKTLEHIFG